MKKFNFVKLDETILPTAKGKNQDGFRFYSIDGKNYPSVTSVLGIKKKKELANWRQSIGEDVANWEMGRAARRGKSTHTLVEQYLKGETPSERSVLPLGLFKLMRPYVDQIDNIHMIEQVMYSKELGLAGQTDCIAEYNGKLSVIDFKTANKERKESWIDNYFLQCTAYATMYKELYGKNIDQIVVLIASEDGAMQSFIKETKDYMEPLKKSIEEFYKYFHEQVKNKTS
jgi:genome maintenance exonuclease 1|tara:strand:+ start:1292 stop:1978 length:687 start_codon:yes stop_codon:yes gene_type:complete